MSSARPQMGTQGDVLGVRAVAAVIDLVIVSIVSFVVLIAFSFVGAISGSEVFGAVVFLLVLPLLLLFQFGYYIYFEADSGQTPGKRLMNIVVVTEEGDSLSTRESAIRNLLRIIDQLGPVPYLVGLVLIFVTEDKQRIGDIVANTVVVRAE